MALKYIKEQKFDLFLETMKNIVPEKTEKSNPVIKSASMIIININLYNVSRQFGKIIIENPVKIPQEISLDLTYDLLLRQERLEEDFKKYNGRSNKDPIISSNKWDLLANEVLILTLGSGYDNDLWPFARSCWKSLWQSRKYNEQAVDKLIEFGKSYSVEPVPKIGKKVVTKEQMLKFSKTLPPVFKNKSSKK